MFVLLNAFWSSLWSFLGGALVGGIAAFFISKRMFEKQLKENPPVNEKMIRAMYMQMGRKPSEAQIRQIMKSMGQ
ncbi:YneF family protein [Erysipelothrix inopinata]|uniref:YneF family protein n=1 Tax=Erysipelothrix inopinata TaxID=225084 RepID=A0A7G9RYM0_9FIRM|nr:YneF family protein [Erysipelothrix inopinata]QNN60695.1 YneF family protein [Erysipelothrix inopinata]